MSKILLSTAFLVGILSSSAFAQDPVYPSNTLVRSTVKVAEKVPFLRGILNRWGYGPIPYNAGIEAALARVEAMEYEGINDLAAQANSPKDLDYIHRRLNENKGFLTYRLNTAGNNGMDVELLPVAVALGESAVKLGLGKNRIDGLVNVAFPYISRRGVMEHGLVWDIERDRNTGIALLRHNPSGWQERGLETRIENRTMMDDVRGLVKNIRTMRARLRR